MMIPPSSSLLCSMLLRRSAMLATTSAAAAAAAACWLMASATYLDCNPTLFVRQFWYKDRSQRELWNKCIWIIGASSGIGEELAYQVCSNIPATLSPRQEEEGDTTSSSSSHAGRLFISSRSVDKLKQVAAKCRELSNHTRQVTVIPVDVTDYQSLQSAVQQIDRMGTALDIVVLNAGRGHLSPALETSATTTRQVLEQTAVWPMLLTPLVMPLFRQDNENGPCPHLVVTSSIAAVLPVPLSAVYAGSKQALQGYFQSLRAETKARIDLICPGPVDTNFHQPSNVSESDTLMTAKNRSPMKMSKERCAELMIATLAWPLRTPNEGGGGRDIWMGPPPTMFLLYLHSLLPTWLTRPVLNRVATKRIQLWRDGLDLYDPKSWKK